MDNKKPIAEVHLPSHHEAVSKCKDGDCVHLVAKRMPAAKPMVAEGAPRKAAPMPLTTAFHVTHITPGKNVPDKATVTKRGGPMAYLKSKQVT